MNASTGLRIATMVSGSFTTPQPKGIIYAPIDIAVAITQGLTERGHTVSYFAPEGSRIPAGILETCNLPPLKQTEPLHAVLQGVAEENRQGRIEKVWEQVLIAHMFARAEQGEYDVLHIHPITSGIPLAISHPRIPVVYTLHDPISPWRKMLYERFQTPNQWFVSISNTQRRPAPEVRYISTVYNGIDLELFPFSDAPGESLLFIGRIHPDKGVLQAIEVAELSGERLVIVGQIGAEWQDFWHQEVEPRLTDKITYAGFAERPQLHRYYQQAKAFLMPIQWDEPFGLVMAEAMACGTPVIALNRGSVPEVVVHGRTGFIVNTVEEMAAAVKDVGTINRQACREHVAAHFSIDQMVAGYEDVFKKVVAASRN
jgi:glycosyltransferase involved in cell wall biosynthesis